ncbi:MAG: leucine--tRNA ligase [Planctomycetaceae bacterium]|nr:leucine--tRNA ligase [Planctomycetaceae bacterium]|tara:strand:- start:728 stop:3562 length:2835 start_codon:yes stop_codon:yes gene_type:complete
MPRYNPGQIEAKWQDFWEENHTFRTSEMPEGEKLYVLDMFPYPSGNGLHVGHPEGYTATDITCRFERMRGKSVLHPMGYDAFGLPAEEHAIKTNTPPRESTEKNIANFTRQLKMLGFSYDWSRCLATTDVGYFKWTQWIFLVLFDTWFDTEQNKGRPISELPIPESVHAEGELAVAKYRDEHRLAYLDDALVNWCANLGTVLANEEVIDGRSERGNHPVQRIPLRQWMLRITAYADRLENDLEGVDWSDGIKKLQRDWIGRSTGAEVDFYIGPVDAYDGWKAARSGAGFPTQPEDDALRVYTTRPDTLYGATYMVIAPEHPAVERLTTTEQAEAVKAYCEKASFKSDRERTEDAKSKTGVFTGSYAVNPVNGAKVPVWVADYVLISYGTGAIMAVPAHDERDYEFAKEYGIDIIAVVDPGDRKGVDREAVLAGKQCFHGMGLAVNSGDYDGTPTAEFKETIRTNLEVQGTGTSAVNYKLRDWLFSRQRFWGEPFPILHELDEQGNPTGVIRGVREEDLPVDLPYLEDYKPHGRPEPPLAKADDDWLYPEIDGKRYRRETNTMPQWAGSCWYYLRYIDPTNDECFIDPEKEKAWMPVDLYVGGAEHAVLHLLYARFWHKVLYDRGHVTTAEPFQRLVNQGMILGEMEFSVYQDVSGNWVSVNTVSRDDEGVYRQQDGSEVQQVKLSEDQVTKNGDTFVLADDQSVRVDARSFKMSKSRGNVINPDEIVENYGADSLRLYEMFMGPLTATKPWAMSGVNGVKGFLDRVWRMIVNDRADSLELNEAVSDVESDADALKMLHKTIQAVTRDTENLDFNTAIARMMEFVNYFTKQKIRPRSVMQPFVLLLAPYAPHIAEELWQLLGAVDSLAYEPWPKFDESLLVESTVEIPIQIKGKVKSRIQVASDISKDDLEQAARDDAKMQELLADSEVVKVIVVPGRLVNFVTK